MYVYGWVVAEGDRQYLTLNKNEYDIAKEIIQKYSKIINQDFSKNTIYYFNKNSLSVAVPFPKIYEKIFFQAMKIGYGARNKNICFLFELEPDLVKIALQSMFKGDGSLVKKGKYQSLNYKTSSKTLAYQLQALLSIKFGIKSTLSYGMNKERMIENRVLKPSDYYNISITRFSDIKKIFDNLDSKIKDCVYNDYLVTSVKKISLQKFYDIRLEDNSTHRYLINGGIITHNCGGANMIDKIKCDKKYGFDNHKYLIALLQQAQKDTSVFPETFNEDLYKDVREQMENKYEDWFIGLVGFCSFGGKWFGGYPRGFKNDKVTPRDIVNETIRNLKKQSDNLKNISFMCRDFRTINQKDFKGYVIYCDIPYKDSTKYSTGNFPYDEFYEWCRIMSKDNVILVSEYWMPDDFKCIWQGELKCTLDNNSRTNKIEKLFTL